MAFLANLILLLLALKRTTLPAILLALSLPTHQISKTAMAMLLLLLDKPLRKLTFPQIRITITNGAISLASMLSVIMV